MGNERDGELRPLLTAVVQVVKYQKTSEEHARMAYKELYGRPYLFVLNPAAIKLITSKDAGRPLDRPASASASAAATAGVKSLARGGLTMMRAAATLGRAPTAQRKAVPGAGPSGQAGGWASDASCSRSERSAGGATEEGSTAAPGAARSVHTLTEGDDDAGDRFEDAEGEGEAAGPPAAGGSEVVSMSISLTQLVAVEVAEWHGKPRLKLVYQPNKPAGGGQGMAAVRGLLNPVWQPLESVLREDASGAGGAGGLLRSGRSTAHDPSAHVVLLEAGGAQEAAALCASIQAAVRQLAAALRWLSRGLPLQEAPVVTAVTVEPGAAWPTKAARAGGGGDVPCGVPAPGAPRAAASLVPFPGWGQRLALPLEASRPSLAQQPLVKVWISSALGPAVAQLTPGQLAASAEAGGAPVTVLARTLADSGADGRPTFAAGGDGSRRLQLSLQICGHAEATAAAEPPPAAAEETPLPAAAGPLRWLGGARASEPVAVQALTVAGVAAVVLANAVQLWAGRGTAAAAAGGSGVLAQVALLVCSLLGLLAIAAVGVAYRGAGAGSATAAARKGGSKLRVEVPGQQPLGALWSPEGAACMADAVRAAGVPRVQLYLELVDVMLREELEGAEAGEPAELSPIMLRTLSVTGIVEEPPTPGSLLPLALQLLVREHPDVLSSDLAERFLIGTGSAAIAHDLMTNMVAWVQRTGMVDVVHSPQPAFSIIKRHYPHGDLCWGSRDCVVELECLGVWARAYPLIKAAGVSDDTLLKHLMWTYEYNFKVLDSRRLPHGKTVKIVDLEGLSLGDLRSEGFRFISKAGALLAANYPQRLHRAFLVNAPSWWAVAWKLLTPIIPKKVRERMFLFGLKDRERMRAAMLEWIDEADLPVAYGGTCVTPLSERPLERAMAEYVKRLNAGAVVAAAAES